MGTATNGVVWKGAAINGTLVKGIAKNGEVVYRASPRPFMWRKMPVLASAPGVSNVSIAGFNGSIYAATCRSASPYIYFYRFNGDAFVRISGPDNLPTATCNSIQLVVYNDLMYVIVACPTGAKKAIVYSYDGNTFTGIDLPDAENVQHNYCTGKVINGKLLIGYKLQVSPWVSSYNYDGAEWTKMAIPAGSSGISNLLALNWRGDTSSLMLCGYGNSPRAKSFQISAAGIWVNGSTPSDEPSQSPGTGSMITFNGSIYASYTLGYNTGAARTYVREAATAWRLLNTYDVVPGIASNNTAGVDFASHGDDIYLTFANGTTSNSAPYKALMIYKLAGDTWVLSNELMDTDPLISANSIKNAYYDGAWYTILGHSSAPGFEVYKAST